MACAVVNGDKIPKPELLAGELLREMPNLKSLVLNSNTARTNVVLGPVCRTLWGEDGIIDELCGLRFFPFTLILLSGEPLSGGAALPKGSGICRADRGQKRCSTSTAAQARSA